MLQYHRAVCKLFGSVRSRVVVRAGLSVDAESQGRWQRRVKAHLLTRAQFYFVFQGPEQLPQENTSARPLGLVRLDVTWSIANQTLTHVLDLKARQALLGKTDNSRSRYLDSFPPSHLSRVLGSQTTNNQTCRQQDRLLHIVVKDLPCQPPFKPVFLVSF